MTSAATAHDLMTAIGASCVPVAEIFPAGEHAEWHIVEFDRCATGVLTALGERLARLADHGLARPINRVETS